MKPNYNFRKVIGWSVIIIISILPAFLWYFLGDSASGLSDSASTLHALGRIFGLVGMTMFALTFVLSTRIKAIEDVFGGLDKVYIAHGILGGTALILILAHPIFLVLKFIPKEMALAAKYLLPSGSWSVNFGIISLLGLIVLIYITLYMKMKYHKWKFTHEFMGAVFILAVLHIFLVRETVAIDYIFTGYYSYAAVVSFIGIGAFSYSLFLKNRIIKNAVYTISHVIHKDSLSIIEMIPDDKPLAYNSGQFVFFRFYNKELSKEAHPFSIASKSNSKALRIVVKSLGDFTSKFEHLKEGDKVSVEGPYGRFNFRNYKDNSQIWIASGIGITPFLGMAQDLYETQTKVDLYYTSNESFIGSNLLKEIESKNKNFKFIAWDSRKSGRIDGNLINKTSKGFEGKEILICGSHQFKESLIKQLTSLGMDKNKIHGEVFDFK